MGIISKSDGDKTVQDIPARDSIPRKFEGLQVLVLDASADELLSSGSALYQYSTYLNRWLLLWSSEFGIDRIKSIQESIDNSPLDTVWDIEEFVTALSTELGD